MFLIVSRLVVALGLLGVPIVLAWGIHRRYGAAYGLILVGVLTFIIAYLSQTLLLFVFSSAILQTPLFGGMIIGIVVGGTDTVARFIGFQSFARGVVYRHQTILIGLGHVLLPTVLAGFWALWLGIGLAREDFTFITLGTAGDIFAEFCIYVAPLPLNFLFSWMVLQTFLRNEIGWVFQVFFWSAFIYGTNAFIVNGSEHPLGLQGVWWFIVGGMSLFAFFRLKPPENFVWRKSTSLISKQESQKS